MAAHITNIALALALALPLCLSHYLDADSHLASDGTSTQEPAQ